MAAPTKRSLLPMVAAFVILIVIWPVIYPFRESRVFLNHRRAVQSIKDMSLAEHTYAAQHPDTGYVCNLSDLGERGLVDGLTASGTRSGYHFEIRCPQDGSQKISGYTIAAVPVSPGTTGTYALCTDQSEQIWYSESGLVSDCLSKRKPIERKYE